MHTFHVLEQPPKNRDRTEERHLVVHIVHRFFHHATKHNRLAIAQTHRRLHVTFVKRRRNGTVKATFWFREIRNNLASDFTLARHIRRNRDIGVCFNLFETLSRLGRNCIALVVIDFGRHHIILRLTNRKNCRFAIQRCNLGASLHVKNLFLLHGIDLCNHVFRDTHNFA